MAKNGGNGVQINPPYDADEGPGLNAASHEEEICNERTSKNNQDLMLVSVRSRNAVSRREDETDQYGVNELNAKLEWKLMISDPNLKSTLMTRLNTFRQNRELCDIVIFVREREVIAHKVVLASISPVLLDKFRNGDPDFYSKGTPPPTPSIAGSGNLPFYELNFVEYESFCALVNYAYTGKLFITNRKVADLYKTAYELEVYPVANACARYIADHLSIQSCIGIRKHANFNKDQFLVDQVDKFIVENIDKIIVESTEFATLTCIKSRIILPDIRKPDIGREISEKALEYFSNLPWISDRNDLQIESLAEKKHLLYLDVTTNDLQDCIKLDEQSQVGACEIIKDYKKGDGVKKIGHNKAPVGIEKIEHHVNGAIPLSEHKNNAKYASNESLDSIETGPSEMADEIETRLIVATETSNNFWISLVVLFRRLAVISIQLTEDDEIIREQSRAASEANGTPIMRESISVNNSTNGSISPASSEQDLSSTLSNIETKQAADLSAQHGNLLARLSLSRGVSRVPLPAMGVARCSIGAVFLEGKIIICGGYDRGECLKSVEQYDVVKGEWSQLPDMRSERGRFDASVANGKIYAVAGSNSKADLNTAECFDPKKNKWTKIKNLSLARSHNGTASLDNYIYCIGGTFEGKVLRDCERYSIETEEWEKITPMQNARYQAATTNWRGYVVAIGGSERWSVLDTVEAYDPKINAWKFLAKLKTPRRGCAVAVVRDCLYVIGGHDGNTTLNSVEILDNPNGSWRAGPPLITPRANTHAVVTAGNVIYVIGGYNANQFLSSIELLENESVGWRNWQLEPEIAIPEESEGESSSAPAPPVAVL